MTPYHVLLQEAITRHALAHQAYPHSLTVSPDVYAFLVLGGVGLRCGVEVDFRLGQMTVKTHEHQTQEISAA